MHIEGGKQDGSIIRIINKRTRKIKIDNVIPGPAVYRRTVPKARPICHSVITVTGIDHRGAISLDQVVPVIPPELAVSRDQIVTRPATQGPRARQRIVSSATLEIAAPLQNIVAVSAQQRAVTLQMIVPRTPLQPVVALITRQMIVPRTSLQPVVPNQTT